MAGPPGTSYLVETWSTGGVPPRERAEFWTDLVTGFHCALRFDYPDREDFRGRTVRQRTPTYQLVGWRSDADVVRRTARAVRDDPDEDYRLLFPMSGRMSLRHAEREFALHAGRAGVTTMAEPFELRQTSAAEAFVMTVPRGEIDLRLNRGGPITADIDLTAGLGRVVRDLAVALFEERDQLDRGQFDAICDRLVELVCMLLVGADRPPSGRLGELEATVRRFVRANAHDPRLTPPRLATALGWSLRQVQLALQAAGTTPGQLIKQERLRLARDRLRDTPVSVTDLAHQLGFSSVGAFSNAFRQRYGVRPRDVRARPGR